MADFYEVLILWHGTLLVPIGYALGMPSADNENWSALRGLLREVSWEGKTVRRYRLGGRGLENVLTAEVLQALDFLPRASFLGAVIANAHGAERARETLRNEIEEAKIALLPGPKFLARREQGREELVVQPDAVLTSRTCYALVEAKRIRRSSFQPEQLAREYLLTMREAKKNGDHTPLMLLVLGKNPPVSIEGSGLVAPEVSIRQHLPAVRERSAPDPLTLDELVARVPEVVSWVTWAEVNAAIRAGTAIFEGKDSVAACVQRLADAAMRAIEWHGPPSEAL